jgi:GNAT superfamily N-acetyltransferase
MTTDIRAVKDDDDLHRFVTWPWALYDGDPAWVPPLVSREKKRLDPARNPFFKKAEAALFLAWRGGDVVGRIAAIDNRAHNEQRADKTGFFGFFETVDDAAVAEALVGAAERWFKEHGHAFSSGPMNLSRVEETGIVVEGHDRRPPFMAGHNPAYYQRLLEGLGYEKERDAFAYEKYLFRPDGSPEVPPPGLLAAAGRAADRTDLAVRSVRMGEWEQEMDHAHRIFVEAFRKLEGNYAMTRAEFGNMAKQLRSVMDKRLLLFLERQNEVVGFALLFPEVNEILSHVNGSLFPIGWAKALYWRRRVETVSFKLMGVLPELRKEGLAAHMALEASLTAQRLGYRRMEMSLVLESNQRMREFIELQEAKPYLRYRLYRRALS